MSTATETRPCGRCRTETALNRLYSSGTGIFVCTACEDALEAQAQTHRAAQRMADRLVGSGAADIARVIRAHRWHTRKMACMCGVESTPTYGHADHVAEAIVAALSEERA